MNINKQEDVYRESIQQQEASCQGEKRTRPKPGKRNKYHTRIIIAHIRAMSRLG